MSETTCEACGSVDDVRPTRWPNTPYTDIDGARLCRPCCWYSGAAGTEEKAARIRANRAAKAQLNEQADFIDRRAAELGTEKADPRVLDADGNELRVGDQLVYAVAPGVFALVVELDGHGALIRRQDTTFRMVPSCWRKVSTESAPKRQVVLSGQRSGKSEAQRIVYNERACEAVRLAVLKFDRDMRLLAVLGNGRTWGDMLMAAGLPGDKGGQ